MQTDVYEGIDKDKLTAWRRVMRQAAVHPPLLHAAICWDAWLILRPESSGAWRATLIASLVMRARGLSESFFVPVSLGHKLLKYRWQPQQPVTYESRHSWGASMQRLFMPASKWSR